MAAPYSIIHLSDLHFGRIRHDILQDLETFLRQRKETLHLAILTGDFTQRARKREFLEAKEFLSSLSCPLFVVPGNHDVPLYNLFLRFFSPYKKFLRYLGPFASNYYEDDVLAVYGLWTPNNFSVQSGKISSREIAEAQKRFAQVPKEKFKLIACHHPLNGMNAMDQVLKLAPHFLLWGHEHQSAIKPYSQETPFPMILAAGTSVSSRTRTEANSFNLITFCQPQAKLEVYRHSKLLAAFEMIDSRFIDLKIPQDEQNNLENG